MGLWHVFYENWQMECCGTPSRRAVVVSPEVPDTVRGRPT
ncbi:DUF6578 domain-containing protein [Streptomyces sp. NPDC058642]